MGKLDEVKLSIDQNITSNGDESITGGVLNAVMQEVVTAAQEAIGVTEGKLTQLSQEWAEIKDANFNVIVNPHIEMVEPQGNTMTIESDKFYKWGVVANLSITFKAPSAPYVGSYIFQFTCPADIATSLAMPIEVVWNKQPLIEAGKTYQVSVVNNLAVITAWSIE